MTSIAVIIPAHNEGPEFGATLVRFADYFTPFRLSYRFTYIIVDDGSTDETLASCRTFGRFRDNVIVIVHDRRYGFGHALRSALLRVCAEYTIIIDGALSYPAAAALELLEALESSEAQVAVPAGHSHSRGFAECILALVTGASLETLTGKLRVFRTQFLKDLAFTGDGPDAIPGLMFATMRAGGRILEHRLRNDWSFSLAHGQARRKVTALQEGTP